MLMSMLKQTVRSTLPPRCKAWLYYLYQSNITHCQFVNHYLVPKLRKKTQGQIVTGPFAGLHFIGHCSEDAAIGPKLLGTFEKELWPVIEEIVSRPYEAVINVGCAEGYYAVGLATRLPRRRMIAFEALTDTHALLWEFARVNGVAQRLELHGFCTPADLERTLQSVGKSVVLCDIEGGEYEVLDPKVVPALEQADILVELHDCLRPNLSREIRRRFEKTHNIQAIDSQDRLVDDWPAGLDIAVADRIDLMREFRGGRQSWYWMTAKQKTTSPEHLS